MTEYISAEEVSKHVTPEDCWITLYGEVWDASEFLSFHPAGSKVVLRFAGQDATVAYDPLHPPGTLEACLKPKAKIGKLDPTVMLEERAKVAPQDGEINLQHLLNLDEIEAVATKMLSKQGWAYYSSAADDQISKTLNQLAFKQILLRPRVFSGITECSTTTTLLGQEVSTPVYVSPAARAIFAHPSAERGIAQGISDFGALQIVSNNATLTPEQIVKEALPGQIFAWQLYVMTDRKITEDALARINKMPDRFKFLCLTLDATAGGNREATIRLQNDNAGASWASSDRGKQSYVDLAKDITWTSTLPWLVKQTSLPIILKGIQTHEDALLAAQCNPQVKAIILSNHGGRNLDTTPPAIHTLLEIRKYCPEVFDKLEVWIDGGIKRGTDVVKALCLGAKAIGLGRAALYGLAAGGPQGVARTFEILQSEIVACMMLLGVAKIDELGLKHVNTRIVERDIYDQGTSVD